MTTETTLEIPLSTAIQSAAAMLTSASNDDTTPILTAAYFDGTHLYATDRYKVARFQMPSALHSTDDRLELGEAFSIPRTALVWVSKLAPKSLRHNTPRATMTDSGYTVRYEYDEAANSVTVSVVDLNGKTERSQAFDAVEGRFPPVSRLFPSQDEESTNPGTQAFNPTYMGAILSYCAKYSDRGAPFKITLRSSHTGDKASPAYIEGAGASFLIQPNLLLR